MELEKKYNYFEVEKDKYETGEKNINWGLETKTALSEDKRYQKYIGKNVILLFVNKKIPVITVMHSDMEKVTGCVKSTPNSINLFKGLKIKGLLGYIFC